ncbi:hypothetical protein GCM10023088_09250 [Actinomadura verrucosospora]
MPAKEIRASPVLLTTTTMKTAEFGMTPPLGGERAGVTEQPQNEDVIVAG